MAHHDASSDSDSYYEPEYENESITIIPPYTYNVLTVLPPPIEYMSGLHSEKKEISGRQVWCGSFLLAHHLIQMSHDNKNLLEGKLVLELGSGTGILGMLASHLKSEIVVLTDGDPVAVDNLQQNLKNGDNYIDLSRVKARNLLWGEQQSNSSMEGLNTNHDDDIESSFEDWCRLNFTNIWKPDETVSFDIILAGDVMYKSNLPELFFYTVRQFLRPSNNDDKDMRNELSQPALYLCHIPRADVTHDVIVKAAFGAGLSIQEIDVNKHSLPESCDRYDADRAKIYRITRP